MRRMWPVTLAAPGALLLGPLLASCQGTPGPRIDELPVRSPEVCRVTWQDGVGAPDVALAIDTSHSTARPAGVDVDQDGSTGRFTRSVMTDPGDSLLAAEVSAVRSLLRSGWYGDARFSLVTYAGRTHFPGREPPLRLVSGADGSIRAGLTEDLEILEAELDAVLARGSRGKTNFAAALQLALRTLEETPPPDVPGPRRRIVLFLSDSPNPVVAMPSEAQGWSTRRLAYPGARLAYLARQALRARVPVHTFALGAAARSEPPHALSSLAKLTGGSFHAVGDPARLHCALLSALAP